ncbi:MAG: low affinity iron permease family protein [Alphaproteobacteria bacterium]|nr:MAG: low affinity iron permease family protein [Alphaproteobacteria bacterium]
MQRFFAIVASRSAYLMGHPMAFLISTGLCIIWAATGPIFHYSDTWQLVINTGTTVLTFLAVFLIQNSQNRDGAAIQAKLDEMLRAVTNARSGFVGIEHFTDEEIAQIKAALEREVLQVSKGDPDDGQSVEELLETCRDPDVDAPAKVPLHASK